MREPLYEKLNEQLENSNNLKNLFEHFKNETFPDVIKVALLDLVIQIDDLINKYGDETMDVAFGCIKACEQVAKGASSEEIAKAMADALNEQTCSKSYHYVSAELGKHNNRLVTWLKRDVGEWARGIKDKILSKYQTIKYTRELPPIPAGEHKDFKCVDDFYEMDLTTLIKYGDATDYNAVMRHTQQANIAKQLVEHLIKYKNNWNTELSNDYLNPVTHDIDLNKCWNMADNILWTAEKSYISLDAVLDEEIAYIHRDMERATSIENKEMDDRNAIAAEACGRNNNSFNREER